MSNEEKRVVLEMAQEAYESGCGFCEDYEEFVNNNDYDFADTESAYNYYCELMNMGPEGFYEEFNDQLDFDESFISEYGEYDY
ncbi:MAG: hypothetical protein IJT36_03500 [Alphaproteobacteria bacterium]|nr:hypothetical protein [Alphaproteobacteria bacterium]